MDDRDDEELLAASGRDPEAFRLLYRRHAEGLLGYLQRRTHDPQDALDVLAETFATVYRKRRSFRPDRGEVAGWIYGIAKFEVARLQRSRARRYALGRRLEVEAPIVDDDSYERIEELADAAARRADLAEALATLSDRERAAVQLRVLERHDYRTVATRLAITETAARVRVHRALARLSDQLEAHP